jgi:hypothetical protein
MNLLLKKTIVLAFIILMGFNLSACRKEEQGRPLNYNKGEYGGVVDEKLTSAKLQKLRLRASSQSWY